MVSAELYLANLKMLDKLFEPIVCVCLSIYRIHVKMLKIYHWPLQRVHKTGEAPIKPQLKPRYTDLDYSDKNIIPLFYTYFFSLQLV